MVAIKEIIGLARTLKVLYVEDNPEARESTADLLSNIFRDVVVAVDGEDGLEKFDQKRDFDLIITDINMPKMSGIEMIARIRDTKRELPVLVLSAHGEIKYLTEAEKLGIDGYLLKPIESKPFMDTIAKTVKQIVTTQN